MANRPFPVANSTTSFWRRDDLDELDSYRSPEWPSESDIVIIGAGYSGASLAHHLLEKSKPSSQAPSIVILEAREACSGATGRNGGHINPDPYIRAGNALATHGLNAAEEVASFEARNLSAFKARDDIKAKLDNLTEGGISTVDDVYYSDEKTAEAVSGVKGAKGCFTHTAGHLWPYKLVLHLLVKAVAAGVYLQTFTPVESVSSERDAEDRWTVVTGRGSIKTSRVIYATNGYTSAFLPEFKDKIVPVRGICSRIFTPSSRPPFLSNSYLTRFNDWEYDYLVPRTDGSIIVGGARRDYYKDIKSWFDVYDDSKLIDSAEHYFDGYMQRHFHGWENSGAYTDAVWTGIMGYTNDGFPYVGDVPDKPGQYICAGFNGHGMAQIFLCTQAVATMIAEGAKPHEAGLPRLYQASKERLVSRDQHTTLTAYEVAMKQINQMRANL